MKPGLPPENPLHSLSSRREILKQKRLAIERGQIKRGKNFSEVISDLEDSDWLLNIIEAPLKWTGLYQIGKRNAQNVVYREILLEFEGLPSAFDGMGLLHLSDLHVDCMDGFLENGQLVPSKIRVDACVMTGDYRYKNYGDHQRALTGTLRLLEKLQIPTRQTFAVLGNHDPLALGEGFEKAGISLLMNSAVPIKKNGEELWVAGVDDPHFFRCHDIEVALEQVPRDAFKLLLAHSPVLFKEASEAGIHLYLCGHTHGGQIRLPGIGAVVKNTSTPRRFIDGWWSHGGMVGLTHRGVGSSFLPLRFRCPPEIWIIELRKAKR